MEESPKKQSTAPRVKYKACPQKSRKIKTALTATAAPPRENAHRAALKLRFVTMIKYASNS